jgi:hypothetical protein
MVPCLLVFKETKFCCSIHGRRGVYHHQKLLCTTSLDVQTLKDYGYTMNHIPLLCDNVSAIKIAYNTCEHSKAKHIDISHHF